MNFPIHSLLASVWRGEPSVSLNGGEWNDAFFLLLSLAAFLLLSSVPFVALKMLLSLRDPKEGLWFLPVPGKPISYQSDSAAGPVYILYDPWKTWALWSGAWRLYPSRDHSAVPESSHTWMYTAQPQPRGKAAAVVTAPWEVRQVKVPATRKLWVNGTGPEEASGVPYLESGLSQYIRSNGQNHWASQKAMSKGALSLHPRPAETCTGGQMRTPEKLLQCSFAKRNRSMLQL